MCTYSALSKNQIIATVIEAVNNTAILVFTNTKWSFFSVFKELKKLMEKY